MAPATDRFRGRVQVSLRLDKELRQQIENAADALRTMNAEIVWRLRASLAEQMADDEGARRHA